MPGGRGKGRGGYQKPSRPAAVSGPGAMSARTDGGAAKPPLPTGQPYGARQQLEQFQQSGPMLPPPSPPAAGGVAPPQAAPPVAPLDPFAPTNRPGEPITAGVPVGPGATGQPLLAPDRAAKWRAIYMQAVEQNWPGADDLRAIIEQAGG